MDNAQIFVFALRSIETATSLSGIKSGVLLLCVKLSRDLWGGPRPGFAKSAALTAMVGSSIGVGASAGRAARVSGCGRGYHTGSGQGRYSAFLIVCAAYHLEHCKKSRLVKEPAGHSRPDIGFQSEFSGTSRRNFHFCVLFVVRAKCEHRFLCCFSCVKSSLGLWIEHSST